VLLSSRWKASSGQLLSAPCPVLSIAGSRQTRRSRTMVSSCGALFISASRLSVETRMNRLIIEWAEPRICEVKA
jgi:hypothetical protein